MLSINAGKQHAVTSLPLTHRDCLAAMPQHAGRAQRAAPWVQLRKYHPEGVVVLCGQVVELRNDGAEWFKVDTRAGPMWAQGKNLRMCSGDGRCTCAAPTNGGSAPC